MSGLPHAPHTRQEQFQFLRDAHAGPDVWRRLCLSLARQAAGLPVVAPSAAAAAAMTPKHLRITDLSKVTRGMVAYWGTPTDDNPSDHITTVTGWDDNGGRTLDDMLNWTNDAKAPGSVDLVRGSFFPARWGDPFMFASPVLGGFWLPGFGPQEPVEKPRPVPSIGPLLDQAMAALRKEIRLHREAGHPIRVKALTEDLRELRETRRRFPRP